MTEQGQNKNAAVTSSRPGSSAADPRISRKGWSGGDHHRSSLLEVHNHLETEFSYADVVERLFREFNGQHPLPMIADVVRACLTDLEGTGTAGSSRRTAGTVGPATPHLHLVWTRSASSGSRHLARLEARRRLSSSPIAGGRHRVHFVGRSRVLGHTGPAAGILCDPAAPGGQVTCAVRRGNTGAHFRAAPMTGPVVPSP